MQQTRFARVEMYIVCLCICNSNSNYCKRVNQLRSKKLLKDSKKEKKEEIKGERYKKGADMHLYFRVKFINGP